MKKVKIENLELFSGSGEHDTTFNNGQEALLSLIYIKTGLIFLKPEKGMHPLMPDNLREYQNLMLMLKSLKSVINEKNKIVEKKAQLNKNLNIFKHYFLDTWAMQNLSKKHQEDLMQFMAEPVESKNKLLYFKLMKYVEEMQESIPKTLVSDAKNDVNDNYKVTNDTPSYNVSLANIFDAMNQLDMQKEYQNMLSAVGIAYSIVSFELIYINKENEGIHNLFNGKVMEFSYVENRTYGLYHKDKSKGANIPLNLENLEVNLSSGVIALKDINTEVREDLKQWEEIEKDTDDNIVPTKIARIISLVFAYMFIYNGYHATTAKGDGITLGKKFYERAVYFKQGLYTFAPSGFFYKVLNLRRLIEITLLEHISNDLELENDGTINFVGESGVEYEVQKVIDIMMDTEKMQNLWDKSLNTTDKEFISAWIKLRKENCFEILPYSSFEFLKFLSDSSMRNSISKYRLKKEDAISRFKNDKGTDTGFYNGVKDIFEELIIKNNVVSTGNIEISSLKNHLNSFKNVEDIFKLLKYYLFNFPDETALNIENGKALVAKNKEVCKPETKRILWKSIKTDIEEINRLFGKDEDFKLIKEEGNYDDIIIFLSNNVSGSDRKKGIDNVNKLLDIIDKYLDKRKKEIESNNSKDSDK